MGSELLWQALQYIVISTNDGSTSLWQKEALTKSRCTGHLRWTIAQWKRVLWSDESVFQVFFGQNRCHLLWNKDKKDHPDCAQEQSQIQVCRHVSALDEGILLFSDGTIHAEKYTEIVEQHILPSRWHVLHLMNISTRQCKTTFCTCYKGPAVKVEDASGGLACLHSQAFLNRGCVVHFCTPWNIFAEKSKKKYA